MGCAMAALEQTVLNLVLGMLTVTPRQDLDVGSLQRAVDTCVSAAGQGCDIVAAAFFSAASHPVLASASIDISDLLEAELQRLFVAWKTRLSALATAKPPAGWAAVLCSRSSLGFTQMSELQTANPLFPPSPSRHRPHDDFFKVGTLRYSMDRQSCSTGTLDDEELDLLTSPAPYRCLSDFTMPDNVPTIMCLIIHAIFEVRLLLPLYARCSPRTLDAIRCLALGLAMP
jgi:hypothetical protein